MSAQKDPARYPFAGTRYLLSHPKLLSRVICYVIIGILFALAALIILLAAALKPQAEVRNLAGVWGVVLKGRGGQ